MVMETVAASFAWVHFEHLLSSLWDAQAPDPLDHSHRMALLGAASSFVTLKPQKKRTGPPFVAIVLTMKRMNLPPSSFDQTVTLAHVIQRRGSKDRFLMLPVDHSDLTDLLPNDGDDDDLLVSTLADDDTWVHSIREVLCASLAKISVASLEALLLVVHGYLEVPFWFPYSASEGGRRTVAALATAMDWSSLDRRHYK
jgi:hypothetical protein